MGAPPGDELRLLFYFLFLNEACTSAHCRFSLFTSSSSICLISGFDATFICRLSCARRASTAACSSCILFSFSISVIADKFNIVEAFDNVKDYFY